jgi:hypothetical protein
LSDDVKQFLSGLDAAKGKIRMGNQWRGMETYGGLLAGLEW